MISTVAAQGAVSHDWVFYVSFFSGIAATWTTLYIKVIRPRASEHKKHEAERDKQKQEEHDWLHGSPGGFGKDAQLSAPEQLKIVQTSQLLVKQSVDKLTIRMDESNGTMRGIKADVSQIRSDIASLAGKPPATVAEVKAVVDLDHDAIRERQTEIMEALHKEGS
jgi:hypothetical protein